VPVPTGYDLQTAKDALGSWLKGKLHGSRDLTMSEITKPMSSGFSNETLILDLGWTDASGAKQRDALVVRLAPTSYQVFLDSDFELQYRLLEVLDRHTEVPVPPMLWFEPDEAVLGAPFFVMRKVRGLAAPDHPSYNVSGWLADASPAQRHQAWQNAVCALAQVHRVPTELVQFLGKPDLGDTGLDQVLESVRRAFVWAAQGGSYRVGESALAWLESNMPAHRPTGLSWGDARIGNILFSDGNVSAIVDWEMASLGGHEMDLGWWLFLDEFHSLLVPRLEGLGSRAETIALWEAGTNERAQHLEWYEILAGVRLAIVMMRIAQLSYTHGVDRSQVEDSAQNNPVVHLLAQKLDIAPPGPLPAGWRG